ncbi:MAG: hypothetical protein QF886_22990, partial [Planctomycetota bacterium]|nr:hypothetical protein [Planctomycetota bacterium]
MNWKYILSAITAIAAVTFLIRLGSQDSTRPRPDPPLVPQATTVPSTPRAVDDKIDRDSRVYHFGRVMEGDIIPHTFGFTN